MQFEKMNGMHQTIGLLILTTWLAHSNPQMFLLASAGEAPYQPIHDESGSTILPQAGVGIAHSFPWLTPYSETTLGYYNQRLLAEQFFGLQLGHAFAFAKPSITLGAGIQTAVHRKYTVFEGDDFERQRKWHFPFGFGLRLDLFEKVYGELEARGFGYPMWKFELGWRVF